MKHVLIDLEENGCTVKEAVDHLKNLGYREDNDLPTPYNATIVYGYSNGVISSFVEVDFDLDAIIKAHRFEKLTIKKKHDDRVESLNLSLSTDEALFLYHVLTEWSVIGASYSTIDVLNSAFDKVEHCVSSLIGFDPVCIKTPSEREMNGDEFLRFSYAVKDVMMKSEQEKPIVFSNPLMQHIGREVVVNDGEGDFTGWVVGFRMYGNSLLVDLGSKITGYTHDGYGFGGGGSVRWFLLSNVKFVNEDGSLSDD